jgi:hypothetical protein
VLQATAGLALGSDANALAPPRLSITDNCSFRQAFHFKGLNAYEDFLG